MIADVSERTVGGRLTAVIAETTSWEAYPQLWRLLLDEVWQTVRAQPSMRPGRNVMLYLDEAPSVEVGAEIAEPFEPIGRVVCSTLPGGRVAMTTLRGSYDEIGAAHQAVIDACDRRGLRRLGPRWEIYGHWREDSAQQEVEIYYSVA